MVAASTKPEREALFSFFSHWGFGFLLSPVLPFPHEGFLTVTVDLPVFSPGFPTGFLQTVFVYREACVLFLGCSGRDP